MMRKRLFRVTEEPFLCPNTARSEVREPLSHHTEQYDLCLRTDRNGQWHQFLSHKEKPPRVSHTVSPPLPFLSGRFTLSIFFTFRIERTHRRDCPIWHTRAPADNAVSMLAATTTGRHISANRAPSQTSYPSSRAPPSPCGAGSPSSCCCEYAAHTSSVRPRRGTGRRVLCRSRP